MTPKQTNFQNTLNEWLRKQAASLPPGTRLPGTAELARTFNVTGRTVARQIAQLRTEGSIHTHRGKGIFVSSPEFSLPPAPQPPSLSSVMQLTGHFVDAISKGELKAGQPMPQIKSICRTFGIGPSTVIESYRMLVTQQRIFKIGKTFRVGSFGSHLRGRPSREAVLFACGNHHAEDLFLADSMAPALRVFDRELYDSGFHLHYSHCSLLDTWAAQWKREQRMPHACIFTHVDQSIFEQITLQLDSIFAPEKKPPVLFEGGPLRGLRSGMYCFARSNMKTVQARTVAQRVICEQVQRVRIFVPQAADRPWSQHMGFAIRIMAEMHHLRAEQPVTICIQDTTGSTRLDRLLPGLDKRFPSGYIMSILREYRQVPADYVEQHTQIVTDPVSLLGYLDNREMWIFLEGREALPILDAARLKQIPVPGRLVAFALDDDPSCSVRGLSSCVPDWETIGYLMAHALIGDIPIEMTRLGFIRARAKVFDRETS